MLKGDRGQIAFRGVGDPRHGFILLGRGMRDEGHGTDASLLQPPPLPALCLTLSTAGQRHRCYEFCDMFWLLGSGLSEGNDHDGVQSVDNEDEIVSERTKRLQSEDARHGQNRRPTEESCTEGSMVTGSEPLRCRGLAPH